MFKALLCEKTPEHSITRLVELPLEALPEGQVRVRIAYSTLNYKDALAITGKAPIAKIWPLVPGIDFSGTVESSADPRWKVGDAVLLNGWGVGEKHWGGLAHYAQVEGDWLTPLPHALSLHQAMQVGTAGYTAMLCVQRLEALGIEPNQGEVLVTGAAGGVGSVAVMLLAKKGYQVVASTGRPEEADYFKALGAHAIIHRDELSQAAQRPLAKERWAAAIDTLGSHSLANVCASLKYHGVVAACGLAQGMDLPATVAPFILRGITLAGVESVYCPQADRLAAWEGLSTLLSAEDLTLLNAQTISLEEAIPTSSRLLAGQVRGRVVVDVNAG